MVHCEGLVKTRPSAEAIFIFNKPDSQCQEISNISAETTGELADIWITSDLFPYVNEAWFWLDNIWIHALFLCSQVQVTIPICDTWEEKKNQDWVT